LSETGREKKEFSSSLFQCVILRILLYKLCLVVVVKIQMVMNLKNQYVGLENEFLLFEIYLYFNSLTAQSDPPSGRPIIPVNKPANHS